MPAQLNPMMLNCIILLMPTSFRWPPADLTESTISVYWIRTMLTAHKTVFKDKFCRVKKRKLNLSAAIVFAEHENRRCRRKKIDVNMGV